MDLSEIPTPALLLNRPVLERNCRTMAERATRLGVQLRPHLKTAKCVEVARIATRGHFGGITVSTVAEARHFATAGILDLTYAVGITPSKLAPLAVIQAETGASVQITLDSVGAAVAAGQTAGRLGAKFDALIEVDTGAGRAGLQPDDERAILAVAEAIERSATLQLRGVMTHAGHAYHGRSTEEIRAIAQAERDGLTFVAGLLAARSFPCATVSLGSTPTLVHHAPSLDGITEVRPGVYTFFDLDQWALGTCSLDEIAVSVLATVIGHNRKSGRILVDAGALALSKDISASEFRNDLGFGLVVASVEQPNDAALGNLRVAELYQEHGAIAATGGELPYKTLPIGAKVRLLPHHACLTCAPFDRYHVIDALAGPVTAVWPKITGWS
jgi:D-serine deaminase-like pyridoxal phosphate-dependent protein